MIRPKLTNSAVERYVCRPGRRQDRLWCGELRGFGVRVSADNRTRTYFFEWRVRGTSRKRYISIGHHGATLQVEDARSRALLLKAQMVDGIDPVVEEERQQKEKERLATLVAARLETFDELLADYLANRRTKHGPLRPATQNDMRRHFKENLADWLTRPWAETTREMCLEKFREISARAPTQANACMRYVRALLNWGREKYATDDGKYLVLATNPVTRLFRLHKPNRTLPKQTRIPLEKVGTCWLWLQERSRSARTYNERCSADWVMSMLLTGMRREESAAIRKDDVDLENGRITLHGDLDPRHQNTHFVGVKNHNTFFLPMSAPLRKLMENRMSPSVVPERIMRRRRVQRSADYIFATNGKKKPYINNAHKTLKALSKIAGVHIHSHAIRRTFDDIAQECGIDGDVRRMLLNHVGGDVHSIHYANDANALPIAMEMIADWVLMQAALAQTPEQRLRPTPDTVG